MTQRLRLAVVCALGALALAPALAAGSYPHPQKGNCVQCHKKKTAGIVKDWRQSGHFAAKITCDACHQSGADPTQRAFAPVTARVCGSCHAKQLAEYQRSRHSVALLAGRGCTRNQPGPDQTTCRNCHVEGSEQPTILMQCARFLKQTPEMKAAGCERCHQVQDSCAACHTKHSTDLAIVRNPNVCATCHMGPDHPQWEAWKTSKHGTLYAAANKGPTCQTCHMQAGTHDVSATVAAAPLVKRSASDSAQARRSAMIKVCADCHGEAFAGRELAQADAIRDQGVALVNEAAAIIRDLYDRGLLDPMPADRAAHPLMGRELVLDHQVLYEDISHVERLFFKMQKYDLAKMKTGAYHQNPDYAHWYGNAEVKMDLVDIEAEARRLERARQPQKPARRRLLAPRERTLESQLRALKRLFERKEISAVEYQARRQRLLDDYVESSE